MAITDIFKSWFNKENKTKTATPASTGSAPKVDTSTKVPAPNVDDVHRAEGQSLVDIVFNSSQLSISLIALNKIESQQQLADIVIKHTIAKVRLEAAQRLHDLAVIADTAEKIKQSDKGAYRILRKKIDDSANQEKAIEQHLQLLEKLCQDVDSLHRQTSNPLFAAKLQSLQQQWQQASKMQACPDALQQRFDQAVLSLQKIVTQQQHEKAAIEHAQQTQHATLQALHDLRTQSLALDTLNDGVSMGASLEKLQQQWQQTLDVHSPDLVLQNEVHALFKQLNQLNQLIEQSLKQLSELSALVERVIAQPDDFDSSQSLKELIKTLQLHKHTQLPAFFQRLQAILIQVEKRHRVAPTQEIKATAKPPKPEAKDFPEFQQLITQISQAIAEGNSRQASQYLKSAQQLAKTHKLHEPRLVQWAQELQQLKDWAEFAILPKKEELVAKMRQLAEHLEAEGLSRLDEIKALQAEWQAVGMVNNEAEKALWQQFKDLSQQAYAPCQQYFDQQKAIQEQNAINREALCVELEQYLAQMPDVVHWPTHLSIIKKAREDWQIHHPVDSKVHKKLLTRFNDVMQGLEKKLQDEYALQANRKQALIKEASHLLELSSVRDACQKAKELQQTWKGLGSCGHAKDQKLWEEFRQQCDAVFAKREEEKQARQQQEQANIERSKQLLENLAVLVDLEHIEERQQQFDALVQELQSLSLPKETYQDTRQQLTQIKQQWQQKIDSQAYEAKASQRQAILDALNLCFSAENAVLAGKAISIEQHQAARQQLNVPNFFNSALNKRWQSMAQLKGDNPQEHAQLFQENCLVLELLLDLPSPYTDNETRTAKKMQLFQQQSYPKTAEEKQNMVQQLLVQLVSYSQLSPDEQAQAMTRLSAILAHPSLNALL
ncbi:DUF349 domain-containing protein [Agitococcus lubricus]|uniref:Uncharacterized protein DUF349 n=1 Tax=Agitococcus lubricus TaxID=1077255 RepID=A0A2T5IWL9_9GAMM|nr:DUF349 domain-containing protein [Agitococcus lubricus]PTQ88292.1 uncharacterized protein DUF349 [Agitococcus lubricus]